MYYDFIDPHIRDILEDITSNSSDLFDFVVNLGAFVCSNDKEPVLAHIAALLAFELRENETTDNIAAVFKNEPIVEPWTFSMRTRSDRLTIQDKVDDAIERAFQTAPAPWISMELLLLKAYALILAPEGATALGNAKKLLKEHPELRCFEPYLRHVEARILWQEGSMEDAIRICEGGIKLAKEYENQYELARLLAWKGIITTSFSAKQSIDLLEEAYTISRRLGDKFHMNGYMLEMAEVSTILGEYDLALEYYNTATNIYTPVEGPVQQNALAVSMLYCDLEDYDEALTWATWNYEKHLDVGSEGDVFALCALAWPMIYMGQLNEAEKLIDDARSLVLLSGHETELGMCHLVTGLHELATGKLETAIMTLKDALHSFKNLKSQVFIIRSLQALANAELIASRTPDIYGRTIFSSTWIDELQKFAQDNELPGIRMHSSILKADFYSNQGNTKEALKVLKDGLNIYDSPGVTTLKKRLLSKIEELERSS
jgi:tetratricopeptide (TPR) repeat protein